VGGHQSLDKLVKRMLLLSGGLDSAATAAMTRPDHCLHIDYGQTPASAERRAAGQVAVELGLPLDVVSIPAREIGAGLMADPASGAYMRPAGTSAEWWPYRNQLLITIGAAWGVCRGFTDVLIGTVASDGARHADGSRDFLIYVDQLLALQEGNVHLKAPAAHLGADELLVKSGVPDSVIWWTHSCHRANLPCGNCPGCIKRADTLRRAGRLQ
jgi:7-cyano-7-deazaguanine synthase